MLLSYFYKFFERSDVVSSFDHSSKYFLKHCAASLWRGSKFFAKKTLHETRQLRNQETKKPRKEPKEKYQGSRQSYYFVDT